MAQQKVQNFSPLIDEGPAGQEIRIIVQKGITTKRVREKYLAYYNNHNCK